MALRTGLARHEADSDSVPDPSVSTIDATSQDGTAAKLIFIGGRSVASLKPQTGAKVGHIASLLVQSFARERRFKRYRSVFRVNADLSCLVGPDHSCIAANSGLAALLGREVLDLERMPLDTVFGEASAELLRPDVEAAFNGESAARHQWLSFPDGQRLLVDIEISPKRDADGHIDAVFLRLFDITKQHEDFCALTLSEENYRALVESMTDFVWETDLDGIVTFVNSGIGTVLGYRAEDMLGRPLLEFVTRDERDRGGEILKAMLADPRPLRGLVNHMRHRDGSLITLERTILPMRDTNAELIGFRGIERDVSQKERQQQLRCRLEAIIEATPDFVSTADAEGRIQYINRSGRDLLGFRDESEYIGRGIELVHPAEDYQLISDYGMAEARRTGSWQGEVRLRRLDGTLIPVSQVILAHRGTNGEVEYYSTIMRDLSERLSAEEKLRIYADDLRRVSQQLFNAREIELRHLARELHDEIGQSLTALKLTLSTLQLANSADAGSMRCCLELLDILLGQIRDMSLDLRPTMLDDLGLEASLRWFVDRCRRNTTLDVQCDIAPAIGRFAPPVETACFRIAQEALTNTMRHAAATKAVIRLRSEPGLLSLRIEDDGQGFDVKGRVKDARWGQSFGLAGMQERASLLGGALRIVSSSGKGTTIEADLPC